ncbi:MAG: hypothetical protein AB7C97_08315 [Oscillospiraceae bacterium]
MASLIRCSDAKSFEIPDCIGLPENEKCRRPNVLTCIGAECPYYQKTSSLTGAQERLRFLDEDEEA